MSAHNQSKKILIVCTGNSCRSQMAHGYLQSLDSSLQVYSAGTFPSNSVNSMTVRVMNELGIDISSHVPRHAYKLINEEWDYLITVCDNAKKECDHYFSKAKHRMHIGFEDPYSAIGSLEYVHSVYVKVRDEIVEAFKDLYESFLNTSDNSV